MLGLTLNGSTVHLLRHSDTSSTVFSGAHRVFWVLKYNIASPVASLPPQPSCSLLNCLSAAAHGLPPEDPCDAQKV